jgi:hypothetical protein
LHAAKLAAARGSLKTRHRLALAMSGIQRMVTWVAIAAIGGFTIIAIGQDPTKKSPPRGRLPAHYKDLVSPEQREEIYSIQAKFNTKIDELEAEIEKLKKQRDAQVERVLTPQQLARLKLLQGASGKAAEAANDAKVPVAKGKTEKSEKDVFPK